MTRFNSAKIFFFFAVLLFVAKPFLSFGMFSVSNPPAAENIFIKAFTKRKQEFSEDSSFNMITVQKKLAEPITQFSLRFVFLLSLLFPFLFKTDNEADNLPGLQLIPLGAEKSYLVNGKLLI